MKKKYFLSFLILLFLLITPRAFAQYCIPTFGNFGCTYGDVIDDFVIKDNSGNTVFSHLETGCSPNAYADYTSDPSLFLELETNTDYNFEVTNDASSMLVQIWIDFDGNESFEDEGELIYQSTAINDYGDPVVGGFQIVGFEGVVTTRMRVKTYTNTATSNSCSQGNNFGGETHDYTVTVIGEVTGCFSPANLAVTGTSSNTVTFEWEDIATATDGYTWHVMKEGERPGRNTPIDTGVLPAGTKTLTVSSISENTKYDFYIRSECDSSSYSIWRSILFYIEGDGASCEKPLAISSLPYSHSDTTLNYLNLYEGNGNLCGMSGDYLSGYETVYHYKATVDSVLDITLSNISEAYSAIFIYEDCADIGVSCPAKASVTGNIRDAHGFEIIVEEGRDYYLVVSSASPIESFSYTLEVDSYGCNNVPAPTGETGPYYLVGEFLSSLEVYGSELNEGFTWYKDVALTQEVTDLTTELLAEGTTYYVTQRVMDCEGASLAIAPLEFTCAVLNPNIITKRIDLCVPGGNVILKTLTSVAGDQVYWYKSEAAAESIAEGTELNVGFVSVNTSYWVTEGRSDADGVLICESERKEIVIDVSRDFPEAPRVAPEYEFCGEGIFTLHDIPAEGEELKFYDELGEFLDLDTELVHGTTYYVVETSKTCISLIADFTVYIREYSDMPEGEVEQTFEEGEMLISLEISGENIRWYADVERTELLPITTVLEDEKTYYATQTEDTFCESLPLGITVAKVLGVESIVFQDLEFMPNPVKDVLYLTNSEEIQSFELYDLMGRRLVANTVSGNEVRVDLSDFSAGVYMLRIQVNEVYKVIQIIKK